MKRCIDSGLWVPNSKMDESDEKEDEGAYAEVKQEQGDANKEWPNRNVISSVFNYSRILWSLDSTAFAGFFHLYLQCVWNTAHVLNLCHITAVYRHKLQGKKNAPISYSATANNIWLYYVNATKEIFHLLF